MTPKQLKTFCDAWEIDKVPAHWIVGLATTTDLSRSCALNEPVFVWMEEEYPTLTLDLLLGVCRNLGMEYELQGSGKYGFVSVWKEGITLLKKTEYNKDPLIAITNAMARFKKLECWNYEIS